jgi:hypothetical protein
MWDAEFGESTNKASDAGEYRKVCVSMGIRKGEYAVPIERSYDISVVIICLQDIYSDIWRLHGISAA